MRSVAHEMFAPSNGERLLDVGCGVGEVARQLAVAVGDRGTVVGLDRSREMIATAESRRDGSRVAYAVGDIASLDYPADHFDGVRCERVLQHLEDPDGALAELVRVTRSGGRICVIDTDWSSLTHDGFDGLETLLDHLPFHPRHLNVGRTIRARMSRAGLRSVTTYPVTLRFTTPDDAAHVIAFFDHRTMSMWRSVPDDVAERFRTAITEAGDRSQFLVALTIWITQGRVPVDGVTLS